MYKAFISNLKKSEVKLKSYDKIFSDAEIDLILYKHSSIPAILWQQQVVSNSRFFVNMLGLIDGILNNIEKTLNSSIVIKNDYEKKKEEYLSIRKKLYENYLSSSGSSEPVIFREILIEYPMKDRAALIEDIKLNHYSLNLQKEFLNSYDAGYKAASFLEPNFKYIDSEYQKLYTDLNENMLLNKKRISLARIEKL